MSFSFFVYRGSGVPENANKITSWLGACVSTQSEKLPGPEWDLPIRVRVPNCEWASLASFVRVLYRILTCAQAEILPVSGWCTHHLLATDRVWALFSACSGIVRAVSSACSGIGTTISVRAVPILEQAGILYFA